MQFRIDSRDPITGLYNVIYPDGSSTPNGIKIYNAEHQVGDPVSATRRSDGMIILDNPVAADPGSLTVSAAGNQAGYLSGQVFNNDEEIALGVSIVADTVLIGTVRQLTGITISTDRRPRSAPLVVFFGATWDSQVMDLYPDVGYEFSPDDRLQPDHVYDGLKGLLNGSNGIAEHWRVTIPVGANDFRFVLISSVAADIPTRTFTYTIDDRAEYQIRRKSATGNVSYI